MDIADLARQHDLVGAHPQFFGAGRVFKGRGDKCRTRHFRNILGLGQGGIFIHQAGQKILVQAAPVDADAHRAVIFQRRFNHRRKLAIALFLEPNIARINPVFRQCLGAGRVDVEQLVADIMKIADQRNIDAAFVQLVANVGNRLRRRRSIDGQAHQFRPGPGQRLDLIGGGNHVGGVGVGHGLHDHRKITAHGDGASCRGPNGHRDAFAPDP